MPQEDPKGSLPSISIVVPTYRRPDALRRTLEAIGELAYPTSRLQIVVVDDGAEQATGRVVAAHGAANAYVQYIPQQNSGAAAARNRGARAAEGQILLFCDDDIILQPEHLNLLLATRSAHPMALVNGPIEFSRNASAALAASPFGRYRLELDRVFQGDADLERVDGECFTAPFLSACNLGVEREAFWELGGFDEAFPFAGAEDQALSLHARRAGFSLIRNHRMRVEHNDQNLTFRQFCTREERSAQTFVVLVSRFPEQGNRPLFAENGPISRSDPTLVAAKKAVKFALGGRVQLTALHGLTGLVERSSVPERRLHRVYRTVLGIHINRGVRAALRARDRQAVDASKHRSLARAKRVLERAGLSRVPGYGSMTRRLRRVIFPTWSDGAKLVRTNDVVLEIPPELTTQYLHRPYEPITTRAFLGALAPGAVVVDVGANLGYYTCIAAKAVGPNGHVHAVEPTPDTVQLLNRNVAINGAGNVTVHEVAAASESGERAFNLTEVSDSNNLYSGHPNADTRETVTVKAVRLDDLVEGRADLIKVDAEGAEPEVLAGMEDLLSRSSGARLLIEWNPACLRSAGFSPDLPDLLTSMGIMDLLILDDRRGRTLRALQDRAPAGTDAFDFGYVTLSGRVP